MVLSQAAGLTKKFILLFIILSVLGAVSFTGYKIWHARYLASLPPPEEKPDMKFGVLPELTLPKSNVSSSNFSYSLDTKTGNLPDFPKVIKVFYSPKTQTGFLSPDKAQGLAEKFDLKDTPKILSETKYEFSDKTKSLTVDLDSGNFSYKQEATATAKIIETEPDDKRLVDSLKNFLNSKVSLPEEIKNGPFKIKRNGSDVEVSLWPQNIDEKQIVTPTFITGLINAGYLTLNYTFWPVDQTTFSTYPIKSSKQAFDELKSGQGIVIIEPAKPQVSITSVYLGYFQDQNYQTFLQPIVVFEGPDFVSYIDAIAR